MMVFVYMTFFVIGMASGMYLEKILAMKREERIRKVSYGSGLEREEK